MSLFRTLTAMALLTAASVATACTDTDRDNGTEPERGASPHAAVPKLPAYPAEALPCPPAGYLCSRLDPGDTLVVARWPDHTTELRVLVPLPPHPDPSEAARRRDAVVRGLLAWQDTPLRLVIVHDDPGDGVDIRVRWTDHMDGDQVGRVQTTLELRNGEARYQVQLFELLSPPVREGSPAERIRERLRRTAAHEMGHALGLGHSDRPEDIMYPEDRSAEPSARDYRTLAELYQLPPGSRLVLPPSP